MVFQSKIFKNLNKYALILLILVEISAFAENVIWVIPNDPLHKAVFDNNVKEVEKLIRAGYDLDHKDGRYITPLYRAISQGNEEMASLLILNGADYQSDILPGQNAYDIALSQGHYQIAALLHWTAMNKTKQSQLILFVLLGISLSFGASLLVWFMKIHKKGKRSSLLFHKRAQVRVPTKYGDNSAVHLLDTDQQSIHAISLDKSESGMRCIARCENHKKPEPKKQYCLQTTNHTQYYEVKWCQRVSLSSEIYTFGLGSAEENSAESAHSSEVFSSTS
ncbi:MAG: ankyrin repeat domain-containing protein [Planctomycetes bacterium]|nr:ankyrin repeat domain-containing protein [Planctomycetota bacterium]